MAKLPDNITYVISKRERGTDRTIVDAFAVPSDNEDVMETATRWAGNGCRVIKPMPNAPISGVKVVGFERRMEGGRAYKVLIGYNKEWLRVDMRDDIMLDSIMTDGIHPGGVLAGTYVWQLHGSQMRLTRVGSQNYLNAVVTKSGARVKKVSPKDFVVGHIYTTPAGQCRDAYLGKLKSIEVSCKRTGDGRFDRHSMTYDHSTMRWDVTVTEYPPRDAWISSGSLVEDDSRLVVNYDRSYWNVNLYSKKSYSYIRDVGNILEGGVKIADILAGIRQSSASRIGNGSIDDIVSHLGNYSVPLTMCPPDETPIIPQHMLDIMRADTRVTIMFASKG
jgi:hypothetical protein